MMLKTLPYTRPRPWGLDLLAVLLFTLTAGALIVALGTRLDVQAAVTAEVKRPAVQQRMVLKPLPVPALKPTIKTTQTEVDPFLPPSLPKQEQRAPAAKVSIESQQKILKIINGDH